MALTIQYPPTFERIWHEWPKWPAGRSKKKPSCDTFIKVDKVLHFTDDDIEHILADIRLKKAFCATWQPEYRSPRDGRPVGPPMFSTYCNQHGWNEPFIRKGEEKQKAAHPSHQTFVDDPRPYWQQQGYPNQQAYQDAVDRAFMAAKQKGMGLH